MDGGVKSAAIDFFIAPVGAASDSSARLIVPEEVAFGVLGVPLVTALNTCALVGAISLDAGLVIEQIKLALLS